MNEIFLGFVTDYVWPANENSMAKVNQSLEVSFNSNILQICQNKQIGVVLSSGQFWLKLFFKYRSQHNLKYYFNFHVCLSIRYPLSVIRNSARRRIWSPFPSGGARQYPRSGYFLVIHI